ncbi:MAG: hydantoinase/oxoprolinase family protein [Chloroflexi bacterium]|nr:hydantoinase/oxoprolinase family protein [Chloroflexota bacterium]
MKRVGVDIGGTFTDVVVLDEDSGAIDVVKTPSTPESVADAPIAGLDEALRTFGLDPRDLRFVAHGCTIGSNTVIERRGAKTALITTKGFRDVLELGRVARPADLLYDVFHTKAEVLAPRYLRREIAERVDYCGQVLRGVDDDEVRTILDDFAHEGVEAVAVCLLFSYLNPEHERRVGRVIAERCSDLHVTLSSAISPLYGEYERTSTAVVNSYIGPAFQRYLAALDGYVERELRTRLYLMQSNGGLLGARDAVAQPVRVLESGPTAGVVAAAHLGRLIDLPNVISFDMGGTTAKAGLSVGGEGVETSEYEVGGVLAVPGAGHLHGRGTGFPISLPAVEVSEVGSGGGSIGWVDAGGAFRVGPRSQGARPGPACYGLGGDEPTVTDAQVVLGVINPANFLGGRMRLLPELSARAIEDRLARPLGLSLRDAARGVVEIANATMAQAIRLVSINKGHDPREFALLAFGGAGPMHACEIAQDLEIPWVVVPRYPGLHSALGLVISDIVHDFLQAYPHRQMDGATITAAYRQLEARAQEVLDADRVPPPARLLLRTADLRYRGQSYSVNVPAAAGTLAERELADLVATFHAKHEALYTFRSTDEQAELVNLRLRAVGTIQRPEQRAARGGSPSPEAALAGRRPVFFRAAGGYVDAPVYDRARLRPGNVVAGPAVIEQLDSTAALPPETVGRVDGYLNIIIGKEPWDGGR